VVIVPQHELFLKNTPVSKERKKIMPIVNVPKLGEKGERNGGQPK
jgi:hypothetical protein